MTRPSLMLQRQATTLLAALTLTLSVAPAAAHEAPTADSATVGSTASAPPVTDVVPALPEKSPSSPQSVGTDRSIGAEPSGEDPTSVVTTENDPLNGIDLSGAGAWLHDSTGWWYRILDGSYPASTWATINGAAYYFNSTGYMTTGWLQQDGAWYYLKASGARAQGWVYDRGTWYYLADDGRMSTGWIQDGGSWYYLKPSGAMTTGWLQQDGAWYYLKASGARAQGWVYDRGTWYYLADDGRMSTGWIQDGGSWYYLKPSGAMTTGWLQQGGTWYYLGTSGAMATGWLRQGGTWYYLDTNGAMATGERVINGRTERFTAGGVWYGYSAPTGYLQPTDHITSLGWATNDLTWGMNGVKVRIVQQRLGIWSSGTLASVNSTFQAAVRNFQARAGLPQTGVVDRTTWDAMGTGYSWWVDQYQATPISLSATRSERVEAMIGYAWNQIGSSYTWGGAGSYSLGFDCSGLVLQSLYAAGMDPQPINVHKHQWPSYRTSRELYAYPGFQHVPFNQRQRGDLVFYTTKGVVSHVSIYLGNDQIIHTDWMGRPARVDHVTAGYSWSAIAPTVVRPFP
ncbi:NlpC/P60 family protein [Actinomyces faecalis]|uniref:NlpC/P60 family protein n=1 Tax=Actinomyces faecalis TaxID=2722820 RepID=UPI0015561FF5|nr:NlpC/P60 family protein [Actinomyces faecalis]